MPTCPFLCAIWSFAAPPLPCAHDIITRGPEGLAHLPPWFPTAIATTPPRPLASPPTPTPAPAAARASLHPLHPKSPTPPPPRPSPAGQERPHPRQPHGQARRLFRAHGHHRGPQHLHRRAGGALVHRAQPHVPRDSHTLQHRAVSGGAGIGARACGRAGLCAHAVRACRRPFPPPSERKRQGCSCMRYVRSCTSPSPAPPTGCGSRWANALGTFHRHTRLTPYLAVHARTHAHNDAHTNTHTHAVRVYCTYRPIMYLNPEPRGLHATRAGCRSCVAVYTPHSPPSPHLQPMRLYCDIYAEATHEGGGHLHPTLIKCMQRQNSHGERTRASACNFG